MSDSAIIDGLLLVLAEAFDGGKPGEGTTFIDGTKPDGSNNSGYFALFDRLTAAQASEPTALGLSIAAHAAHVAYHMEVTVRWVQGERGPFDWPGSFEPRVVNDTLWDATRERVRTAYAGIRALAHTAPKWDADSAAGLAGVVAHATYHLGAIRQVVKLLPKG